MRIGLSWFGGVAVGLSGLTDSRTKSMKLNLIKLSRIVLILPLLFSAVAQAQTAAGVMVSDATLSVMEGSTVNYTLRLASQPANVVTISVMSNDPGAASVSPATLTFSTTDWETLKPVMVRGEQDDDANNEVDVQITHMADSADANYDDTAVTIEPVAVTVDDDETARVMVSETDLTFDEGTTNTTYTLVLEAAPTADMTISVMSSDAGAASVSPATLIFTSANWGTAQPVTVTGEQDDDADNETVSLTHTSTGGGPAYAGPPAVTIAPVNVTVTDNETARVMVSETDLMFDEGTTNTTYTLVLEAAPTADMTISVMSDDAEAASVSPATLIFTSANWGTAQPVTVTGEQDDDADNETVSLTHTSTGGGPAYAGPPAVTIAPVNVTVTDNETARVMVSETDLMFDEGTTNTTYTLVLEAAPTADMTISVMSDDAEAASVSPATLIFTSANWGTAQPVTVTGEQDDDADNETVSLTHTSTGGGPAYAGPPAVTIAPVNVTVTDNETARVMVSETDLMFDEGTTNTTYTLVLEAAPTADMTISVMSDDAEAASVSPATLIFTSANWGTAQPVTVTGEQDDDADNETVSLTHTSTGGGPAYAGPPAVTIAPVNVTVTDNETARVMVSETDLMFDEGTTNTTYTLVLEAAPTADMTISVMSDDAEAASVSPATLIFTSANWGTAQPVTVTGEQDDDADNETVSLTHTSTGGGPAYAGPPAVTIAPVNVTVTDNETARVMVSETDLMFDEGTTNTTYTLVLEAAPTADMTISVMSDDAEAASVSPATLIFTSANWGTAQPVTVTGEQDDDADNETVSLTHTSTGGGPAYAGPPAVTIAPVNVTVTDNETARVMVSETDLMFDEGTTNTTYTLVLEAAPTADMTISVMSDDAEAASVSPATLIFTSANWGTAQPVTVTGEQDDDADNETVSLTHTSTGGGPAYAGPPAVTIAPVNVTVTDNETARVMVSETDLMFDEGTTNTTYTLVLEAAPTADMTISVMSDDAEAASVSPATLIFTSANWGTAQPVTVTGEQDDDADNETVSLTHTSTGGGPAYAGPPAVTIAPVNVTVTDNETARVMVSETDLMFDEGTTNTTYTLVLEAAPTADMTISVMSSDAGAASVSPATLIFTSANWGTAQPVTVTGEQDDDADNETVSLTHTSTGGGPAYAGPPAVTIAPVNVTVTDNETARVMVSETDLMFDEGTTNTTYTLVLEAAPTADMTISVMSDDAEAASVSPATLIFTSANWGTAQPVTVTGEQDDDADNETVSLTHTSTGGGPAYAGPPAVTIAPVNVTVTDNETARVMVSETDLMFDEGTTNTTYTLVLEAAPTADMTISVMSDDAEAASVSPATLIFTSANWGTAQPVTVTGEQDDDADNETVSLTHTSTGGGPAYAGPPAVTIAPVNVTVTDNETARVMVSETDLMFDEGTTNTTYTLVLEAAPTADMTISVMSDDAEAASVSPATLIFTSANWGTAQPVTVTGEQDDDADNETVSLTHTSTGGGPAYAGPPAVTIAPVNVTVTDNETARVMVSETDLMFDEGTTNTTYTLVLEAAPTADMTISVMSDDAEAASVSPATLIFTSANWGTAQPVTVTGEQDDDADNETVSLTHTSTGGGPAYAGPPAVTIAPVNVTVTDNETARVMVSETDLMFDEGTTNTTYTLVLEAAPTADMTISVMSDDAEAASVSPATLIFTSANWGTAQPVTVTGEQDDDADNETVSLTHTSTGGGPAYAGPPAVTIAPVNVTVTDNETARVMVSETDLMFDEGTTNTTYTLVLEAAPTADMTISVMSSDAGAASVSPATLIFTSANWGTAQPVTVTGEQDDDADNETVSLTHTSTGGGPAYAGPPAVTIAPVNVTVTDNETARVTVSQTALTFDEGTTNTTYTLVLDVPPTADMTISVMSSDAGAASVSPSTLTFDMDDWATPKTVTVTGEQDDDADNETVSLTHTSTGGGPAYAGPPAVTIAPVNVTVTDNETARVTVSQTALTFDEGTTNTTYTLVLDVPPTADMTISVMSSDAGAASVSPSTLTFDMDDWATPKTVTVTGEQDDDADNETVSLTHTSTGGGPAYAGPPAVTIAPVNVTVTDNETARVTVSQTALTFDEGTTNTTYTLVLDVPPTADMTISVMSSDAGAASVSPSTLTFDMDDWATPKTVTVTGEQDDDADNETVSLTHTSTGGGPAYAGPPAVTIAPVNVTVTDNETARVTVSQTALTFDEGTTNTTYTLVLDVPPTADMTISVMSSDAGAASVSPATLSFTTTDWETPKTVMVTGEQDADADNETVSLTHTSTGGGPAYAGPPAVTIAPVNVMVDDDEEADVTVMGQFPLAVGEGATATYTLELTSQPRYDVVISVMSSDAGAARVSPAMLTFTMDDWDTPKMFTVMAVDDDDANNERVVLTHTASSTDMAYSSEGGRVTIDTVTVNVTDNDMAGVTVSETALRLGEGEMGNYMLMLNTRPNVDVTIMVAATGDTDAATVNPTTLTFTSLDWNTGKTVTVTGVDDGDANEETVTLTHTAESGGTAYDGVPIAGVIVTVTDNERVGVAVSKARLDLNEGGTDTYTLMLTSQPRNDVVITVASGDADAVSVDPMMLTFDMADWNTGKTVTVMGAQDDDANNEVDVEITHTASSTDADYNGNAVTIAPVNVNVDDDEEAGVTVTPAILSVNEGETVTYRLALTSQPANVVTISVTSNDPGAASVSPATLTFSTTDWETLKTVMVTGEQDDDANNEVNVQLTHTAESTDATYNGRAVTIGPVAVTVDDDEMVRVAVSRTELTIAEGATAEYTLRLATQPRLAVTIAVMTDDEGAATVNPASLIFTPADWNVAKAVTVNGVDDNDVSNESVNLTHMAESASIDYNGVRIDAVAVTVTDNDRAGVIVSQTALTLGEGATGTYTLMLRSEPTHDVTIALTNPDMDAVAVDATSLTFTTLNWNMARTVMVTGEQDADANNERVRLTHTATSMDTAYNGNAVTIAPVNVNVDDDEDADVTVVGQFPLAVSEGATATYKLELTSPPTVDVTVAVMSSTAAATVNSTPPLPLIFTSANWNTAQTVMVMGAEDADANNETATLTHTLSGGGPAYVGVMIQNITVNVTDNEAVGVTVSPATLEVAEGATVNYTMVLNTRPSTEVAIAVVVPTGAGVTVSPTTPLTFTTSNWNTARTVMVTGIADADANNESVQLTHTVTTTDNDYRTVTPLPVSVTVNDDETAGVIVSQTALTLGEGVTGTYMLMLSSEPTHDVTIALTNPDMGAVAVDTTSLTFTTLNWNMARTVMVTGEQDTDANNERVRLTHTATSMDTAYNGNAVTIDAVDVTVNDNETVGVAVSAVTLEVAEGGTGNYTLALDSRPGAAVTIVVRSGDEAAVTVSPGSLTFTTVDWATPKTVTVTGEQDADASDDTGVQLSHTVTSIDLAYNAVKPAAVAVTVNDDEMAGVTVSAVTLDVNEGETGIYTMMLNSRPSAAVTIAVRSGDSDAVMTTTPLTFNRDNWNVAQTVTVRGVEDMDANNETGVELTHAATSMDTAYSGVPIAAVAVTVDDDEEAGVTVSQTALTVSEGGNAHYTLALTTRPSADVMITVRSADTDAVSVNPTTPLTFTTSNWNTAQIVMVTGVEDADASNESEQITHTVTSTDTGYSGVTPMAVTVNVNDNEAVGVTVSQTTLAVTEGGTGTYMLALNTQPSTDVSIAVVVPTGAGVTVSPTTPLTFTMANWNVARAVMVTGEQDMDANNESVQLTHTVTTTDNDYRTVTPLPVSVTVNDDETAGVIVSQTALTLGEGATGTYMLMLSSEPTHDVTIALTNPDMGAVAVDTASLTFTTLNWNMARTVMVTGEQDTDANNERVRLTHAATSTDTAYSGVTIGAVDVTVNDDDTADVTVSAIALDVNEGGTATYTLALTTRPSADVMITVMSDDREAVTATTSLTFTMDNWNVAKAVTVRGVEDADANDETAVRLTHAATSTDAAYNGSVVSIAAVAVTVDDNDTAGVTVSTPGLTVGEGSTGTYMVALNTRPSADVMITVESGNTAAATVSPASLTFTMDDWNTGKTVTVSGIEDADATDATVQLTHAATSVDTAYNGNAVTIAAVAVTVDDNEEAGVTVSTTRLEVAEGGTGTYTLALNTRPSAEVKITVMSADREAVTATTSLTFTVANWNVARMVTVRGVEDADANDETGVLLSHAVTSTDSTYNGAVLSAVAVTVDDDEAAGVSVVSTALMVSEGGIGTYTLELNTRPSADVLIAVVVPPGAGATVNPTPLTFTMDNWNTTQTVTVTGVEDADANNASVELTHTVTSTDPGYRAVIPAAVSVTVNDNEAVGVSVSSSTLKVAEGGTGIYTLELNTRPSAEVMITVMSADREAVTATTPLTFTVDNWNSAQTVMVRGVADADANNESVQLSHTVTSTDAGYNAVMPLAVIVTVDDDETAGVTVTPTELRVGEGSTGTYMVVLTTRPSADVMITVASDDMGAATFSPASLTFGASDWNTAKTVMVTGEQDADANDENVQLTHTVSSSDRHYSSLTPSAVALSVIDDETAGVNVMPTELTVGEGSTVGYTLVLDTPPTDAVTVVVTSADPGAVEVSPTELTFTTADFNMLKTVLVTGVRDTDTNSERVRITHTVSSNDTRYARVTPDAVVVTVSEVDLDVDGSGGAANQSDGLMIGRYLFGIRDTVGLVDTIPGSPSFDAVTANLARAVASGRLDVDGSGGAANQSDGLMIGRYLFGIRDEVGLLDTIPGNPSFSAVRTNIEALLR